MCASLFLMMSVEPRASHLLSQCPTPELFLTQRAPGSGVFSVVEGRRREGVFGAHLLIISKGKCFLSRTHLAVNDISLGAECVI